MFSRRLCRWRVRAGHCSVRERTTEKSTDGGATWNGASWAGLGGMSVDPARRIVVLAVDLQRRQRVSTVARPFSVMGLAGTIPSDLAVDASIRRGSTRLISRASMRTRTEARPLPASAGERGPASLRGPRGVFRRPDHRQHFLTKFDPSLSQIVYSTFFGPGNITPTGVTPTCDTDLLAGNTQSRSSRPRPARCQRPSLERVRFARKLSADGSKLIYSTVLNGLDVARPGDRRGATRRSSARPHRAIP
jgi:hypothetical protein